MVLDASTVVELLIGGDRAERVLPWMEAEEGEMHAPSLLDVEVLQVLRRLVAAGVLERGRANASIEILQTLPVTRHVETPLIPRVWALRDNFTAYDATYLSLAEALDAPLLTFDAALARAPNIPVRIELLRA